MRPQHQPLIACNAATNIRPRWLLPYLLLAACKPAPPPTLAPSPTPELTGSTSTGDPSASAGDLVPELPAGIHQQTIRGADGAVIRYTILVPEGYSKAAPVPLIVMLHYGGEVVPFYGRGMIDGLAAPAFRTLHAVMIAPDSLGGDWTTEQNGAAVAWLTKAVMRSYAIDPKKVVLSGYSMGGIGTWHIGFQNQDLFTAAIPVSSRPAGGTGWRIPLYVIHSRDDEILPIAPVRDHVAKLKAGGIRVEWRELEGLTHYQTGAYAPALREAADWLTQAWSNAGPRPPR